MLHSKGMLIFILGGTDDLVICLKYIGNVFYVVQQERYQKSLLIDLL